ncbi:uncharacterized protein EDB91DRAFT_1247347 [Suillus paluster]|uniref:uncharacterized protein n=1 Tax=Suillus paluster TaxID=48578 RepID=UPI001B86C168|nr:uncharacterized protein EDB91DRAFT_1247347 [Suillus paluster]KAG1743266.1 hypothetical protein EDB91DRAFT_1247347 [Suillus paluster]
MKCILAHLGTLATTSRGWSAEWSRASLTGPSTFQSKVRTRSQSQGLSVAPSKPQGNLPKARSQGQSKPTGSAIMLVPPAAVIASLSSAAPHTAMDLPIPDLHSMSMAICESTTRITALEAHVLAQWSICHSPSQILLPPHLCLYSSIKPLPGHSPMTTWDRCPSSTLALTTGKECSTIVALVMEPTILPSQTEVALDPPTAIASTVPIDAVHSPADDGVSTFASTFALPAPLAIYPTPLETPKDVPSAADIVESGSPLNLLLEYDSSDEQDVVMQM